MANYIDAIEQLSKIAPSFKDAAGFEIGLTKLRTALVEMSESTEEAYAEGGEARAVLVAMQPVAVFDVVRAYNRILKGACELNPENDVIGGLNSLDADDSRVQLAWIEGKLASQVLSDVDKIFSELGLEIKSDNCFIATAVIGDEDHPDLKVLRNFRDLRLKATTPGKLFIVLYYRFSPPIARLIGRHVLLRRMTSLILIRPLIYIVRKSSVS